MIARKGTDTMSRADFKGVGLLLALICALVPAGRSAGDATEDLPVRVSEIPKVLFIVERNIGMQSIWYNVTGMPTRWEVVQEAIIAAVNSAPTEMEFAIIGTSSASHHYLEISSFDHSNVHLTDAILDADADIASEYIGSSYNWVVEEYLSLTDTAASGFDRAPFRESCSEIDVIVIGDRLGSPADDDVTNLIFAGDFHLTVQAEDEVDQTFLDDVAFYAANNDLTIGQDGVQTVRTHAIQLDADTVNDQDVEDLFVATAGVGGGIYTRAVHPDDVAVGISLAMTDKLRSLTGITTSVTSAVGHRLFRGWTEIWGFTDDTRGVPLYRGHFEAFQVINDPSDPDYGDVQPTALWDAGVILASRLATAGESNSNNYVTRNPNTIRRNLFTNPVQAATITPRDLVPFDADSVSALGALFFEDYLTDYTAEPTYMCTVASGPYARNDLTRDCVVNDDDAQEVIDFLRGVDTSRYGAGLDETPVGSGTYTGTEFPLRGTAINDSWKIGGMFLSEPAFADARPPIFTDDPAFYAFLNAIDESDNEFEPVIYVPANDGFIHAFTVPFLDSDGDGWEDGSEDGGGGWELWAYIPRHLLDHDSDYHADHHRALHQMLDGELYLNDGSVNLTYVWMDGEPNLINDDCTSASEDGAKDPLGCEYHRVLVVSMGLGSRYHYALDVTRPYDPKFLWEWFGDISERKGLSTGTPVIGEVLDLNDEDGADFVPVVFWTSGVPDNDGMPSSSHASSARWYMVKLLDPGDTSPYSTTGYRLQLTTEVPYLVGGDSNPRYAVDDAAAGLFSTPAAVDYDEDGTIDALYLADRHGYVYKVLIDNGDLTRGTMEESTGDTPATCVFATPYATPDATDADAENHGVFFRPSVARDISGAVHVTWGTGWPGNLFEPYDNGYLWFGQDGSNAGDEWGCSDAIAACGISDYPKILGAGEKLAGPVLTFGGIIFVATYITDNAVDGAACGVGHARIYAFALDTCDGAWGGDHDYGPENLEVQDSEYVEIEGIPSRFSYSNDGVYITVTRADGSIDSLGPIRPVEATTAADRVNFANWRNVF